MGVEGALERRPDLPIDQGVSRGIITDRGPTEGLAERIRFKAKRIIREPKQALGRDRDSCPVGIGSGVKTLRQGVPLGDE